MEFSLIQQTFYHEINQPDEQINLAKASLYFAQTEYPSLEIDEYLNALGTMAEEVRERLPDTAYPLKTIKIINQYLFEELGFTGNTTDYYDPRNSFLNEVIERRTGIPITLSVVYLEIAKRLDFPMLGIGMPGHFLIRPNFEDAGIFVDVFDQGEIIFEQDCEARLRQVYQQPIQLEFYFLESVSNQQILVRMLTNLKLIYMQRQQLVKALNIVELILLILPNHPRELRDRGLLFYQLNEFNKACQDLELYLTIFPDAEDTNMIRQLLREIRE